MLKIVRGNLVKQKTDGIINPIHADLTFERGIPFFIRRNGGDEIEQEVMRHFPAHLGDVFSSTGGTLAAKHVIHLVNREFRERTSYRLLESSLKNALLLAAKLKLKSLSIPPIYNRFSPEITAHILCDGIADAIAQNEEIKKMGIFVVIYDRDAYSTFFRVFKKKIPQLMR